MLLPECQFSTHLRLKQNEVVQTLQTLNDCTHCPKSRNFFLLKNKSNSHSTSKLCVSAGPEPSGPEPVLLQVFSICWPRVRSPLSEDPSITAEREAAFLLFEPNHQQRGFQRSSWNFLCAWLFFRQKDCRNPKLQFVIKLRGEVLLRSLKEGVCEELYFTFP